MPLIYKSVMRARLIMLCFISPLLVVLLECGVKSRHGESQFNVQGLIGGNPPLSLVGEEYAVVLEEFVAQCDDLKSEEVSARNISTKSIGVIFRM